MNLDEMIKYIIWVIFFMLALTGLYFILKKVGVL